MVKPAAETAISESPIPENAAEMAKPAADDSEKMIEAVEKEKVKVKKKASASG